MIPQTNWYKHDIYPLAEGDNNQPFWDTALRRLKIPRFWLVEEVGLPGAQVGHKVKDFASLK